MGHSHIHKFWWLWLPLAVFAAQIVCEITLSREVLGAMLSENGAVELAQFFVIVAACVLAYALLFRMGVRPCNYRAFSGLGAWVALAAVAGCYVAGEEVSWGQHFLNWDTPEYWAIVNDQNETNFHNTSSWLDQKPRMILHAGIIVGGIIMPLLMRFRPGILPARFAVIYPPIIMMPTALLVSIPYFIDKTLRMGGHHLFERVSEVQELYMYYFVLLYLVVLWQRVVDKSPGKAGL